MFEPLVVTFFPVIFLGVLFVGGELFRRKHLDMDGEAPIERRLFYGSKYLILVVWAAMVVNSWGVKLSLFSIPTSLRATGVSMWVLGFLLLLLGRLGLGSSFRIGSPREPTQLRVDGLFRISRNPMYLGVYAALLGSVLRTLNPILLLCTVFIVAVHHKIVLAEEDHLQKAFGEQYRAYCSRVRRYI